MNKKTLNTMQKIVNKIVISIKTIGLSKTIFKLGKHLYNRMFHDKKTDESIFRLQNIEDRFTEIYRKNIWRNFESVSGNGSTFEGTENLRKQLPQLINKFSITTIFDAPCGDFNWMRHALETMDINYIGGDIVKVLTDSHQLKYSNEKTSFLHIDLTKDSFPEADLMLCRDCLFHLSYNDTKLVLQNFIASNIQYLLTTTYINNGEFNNQDINTGGFRLIDLFSAPYHFKNEVLYRIDDSISNEIPRELCLWSRDQILAAIKDF